MRTFELTREFAQMKDQQDPLAKYNDHFYKIPDTIYMDGNSLGLCSKEAEARILEAIEDWKEAGIGVWEDRGYFLYQDTLGALCAPLINADPDEVTIMNSTTMNLHQAIATFYEPTAERYKILVDDINFPTDRYAIDSEVRIHGLDPAEAVKVVPSKDGQTICEDDVIAAMTDDVAIAVFPSALYRSAQVVDMKKLTDAAHARGIIIGFDLCHSIGVVPHDFKDIQPDFAVWCDYKYLNGGPGAIAGFYINRKHFAKEPGLAGWHGNVKETQFELRQQYEHLESAGGFQSGTQPVFSMAALEASLKMIAEAGLDNIREKSLDITAYLMYLIDEKLTKYGFRVGNPREDEKRTGHVALVHDDALRIDFAMKDCGVLPDFRFPDVIRLAPAPLYTSYEDVYDMVEIIIGIMEDKTYENYTTDRGTVV